MPKPRSTKLIINFDLLKPQSNPEKTSVKILRWLLSTGRYIFIFVEAVVLIAFIARFKLDEDLASKNEAIKQQVPYIQSLKSTENLIRQTQLKIASIDTSRKAYPDYAGILKKISDQIPSSVKINSLNIDFTEGIVTAKLSAQTQINSDLGVFISNLKQTQTFSDVNIDSVGFEKGNTVFSMTAQAIKEGIK